MSLFEFPARAGRNQDNLTAKKSQTKKKITTTRGGSDLLSRINEIKAKVDTNLGQFKDDYLIIRDKEVLHDYITECIGNQYVSLDTETTGLDPLQDKIVGICGYTRDSKAMYLPLNHISYITNQRVNNQIESEFVISEFKRLLDKKPYIDMFNSKFDIRVLRAFGLSEIYCTYDGYLAARLMNENETHNGLKYLHNKYVLDGKADAFSFDELFKGITADKIPIDTFYMYAAHDSIITTELCDYQRKYMYYDETQPNTARNGMNGVAWVFYNIEMPCVSVVADMEDIGVELDTEYTNKLSVEYHSRLNQAEKSFYDICDTFSDKIAKYRAESGTACKLSNPINISSPIQLAILLYDILELESVDPKNPRGTGDDILARIEHPIAEAIREYRSVQKLLGTYIDALPECVNPNDGRIHCSFNQYGAKTGRFSSSDPNLQNIPSHNKDIRKMFKATDGYYLLSSDYSQQEPKVMTQMCQDEKMIKAYQDGKDLYAEIASLSFNTDYENCLEFNADGTTNKEGKARRSQAKSILLGVLYGRGVPSIAEQLGTTTQKAQSIKDSVFKGFPAIPQFEEDSLEMAETLGYVTTLWGRKRRLPDLQLDEFEFSYKDGAKPDNDLLDFDSEEELETEVPEAIKQKYTRVLRRAFKDKKKIIAQALSEYGIIIKDNGAKIADAQRQCVNARIQGSAADMSKLAMIKIGNDKKLKELGFRLLIPVHDELIGECPKENISEVSERFSKLMSEAAGDRLHIPISCDVEVTECWYGTPITGEAKVKESNTAREFENEITKGA